LRGDYVTTEIDKLSHFSITYREMAGHRSNPLIWLSDESLRRALPAKSFDVTISYS